MIQYDKLSAPLQDLYNRVYAATLTECMKYDASGQGVFDHERAAKEAEAAVRQAAPDTLREPELPKVACVGDSITIPLLPGENFDTPRPCLDPDKMNGAGDQFPGSDF